MKKTLLPLVLCSLTIAGQARADERVECASAYEQTQRSQQKGEMMTALDQANRCARATCPNLLKKDCVKWVTEIQSKLPTVVVRVRGSDGCEHTDAKVNVTGSSHRGTDADADAIVVDPGTHDLIVSDPAGTKTKTSTINFAAGEHRDIDIDFGDPDAVCGKHKGSSSSSGVSIPTPSLVIGGIGVGLFVTGFFFGVVGKSKRDDLEACRPNCSQDKIDAVKPFFVIGDVIGGVGLVGIGAAVVTYFILQPKKATAAPAPEQEKEKEKEQAGLRLLYASPAGFAGIF